MSWGKNPYYRPQEMGLEPIAEIDYSSGNYEFDLRVVWRHAESGELYTARDSGCSCPSPFESFNKLEKLSIVSMEDLEDEFREELNHRYKYVSPGDIAAFRDKIRAAKERSQ